MRISFVVPTYRRPDTLRATLAALRAADPCGCEVEIIVVDDDPAESAREVAADTQYVRTGGRGAAATRNAGAEHATGELLVFCDDDMLVEPAHIAQQLETRERLGDCAVNGEWLFAPEVAAELRADPFGRYRLALEERFRLAHLAAPELAPGCVRAATLTAANLALRRQLFVDIGGFDTAFPYAGTEDQDLSLRLEEHGVLLVRNTAIRLLHAERHVSLDAYCAREERGAQSVVVLARKYPQRFREAAYVHENGPARVGDSPVLLAEKALKRVLVIGPVLKFLHATLSLLERLNAPPAVLNRAYESLIGLHSFRGVRLVPGGLRLDQES